MKLLKAKVSMVIILFLILIASTVIYYALPVIQVKEFFAEQDKYEMVFNIPRKCDMCEEFMQTWNNAKRYAQANQYQVNMSENMMTEPVIRLFRGDKFLGEYQIPNLESYNETHMQQIIQLLDSKNVPRDDYSKTPEQNATRRILNMLEIPEKDVYTAPDLLQIFQAIDRFIMQREQGTFKKNDYIMKFVIPDLCDICVRFMQTWANATTYASRNNYDVIMKEEYINAPSIFLSKNGVYVAEYHPPNIHNYTEEHMMDIIKVLRKNGVPNQDSSVAVPQPQQWVGPTPDTVNEKDVANVLQSVGIPQQEQYTMTDIAKVVQYLQPQPQ
jgi:hypothetical protein